MNAAKLLTLLLLVSISLNVFLMVRNRRGMDDRNSTSPREAATSAPTPANKANTDVTRFDWRRVESADYRRYIANLRSIGVPEETVRDIIVADVGELFKLRWKERVERGEAAAELPMGEQPLAFARRQLEAQAAGLHREKAALLKELLGDGFRLEEAPFEVTDSDVNRALVAFLPAEKEEAALELMERFGTRWDSEIKHFFGNGPIQRENRPAYIAYKRERDAAVKAVLSAEEKEEYDRRFSQLANFLQHKFQGLPLTESQFVELYRYARKYDDALDFYLLDHSDPATQKAHQEASMDVYNKAMELAGMSGSRPIVRPETAARFGF